MRAAVGAEARQLQIPGLPGPPGGPWAADRKESERVRLLQTARCAINFSDPKGPTVLVLRDRGEGKARSSGGSWGRRPRAVDLCTPEAQHPSTHEGVAPPLDLETYPSSRPGPDVSGPKTLRKTSAHKGD